MAYDLKQKGTDVLEIGLQVKWISGAEAKDLIEDGRRKGKEVDLEKLAELSENNSKEYGRLLAKAQAVVSIRFKGNIIDIFLANCRYIFSNFTSAVFQKAHS
jgi:aldehyde:ferredoxin oxidoreductase